MEWSLFRTATISSAVEAVDGSGLEWWRVVRKEHLGGTKMLKKLFEQRKMRLRSCCKTGHHLICNFGYPDNCPNGHHSEWAQSRRDTIPNGHNPEWTPSRMDTIPNGHHPEWTQSRMDTIPNEHLPSY